MARAGSGRRCNLYGIVGVVDFALATRFYLGHGRPLIAGLFTAIFLVYNISFGLWQGWLIFALILLCAIVRALRIGGVESNGATSV